MTVGFHSPMPPVHSGVADYSAALLCELRRHGTVTVDAARADIHLYHLGNNQLHLPIYRKALEQPGVVVLHDAVLQHFYLGSLTEAEYIAEYVYNYGEWERDAARDLYADRAASGTRAQYFRRPMLRRIAEHSRAIIVHNAAAAKMVRDHAPDARVIEIPHFYEPVRIDPGPVHPARFGVFGYLRESKRLLTILGCFDKLRAVEPRAELLIAGEFASADLAKAVAPWRDAPGVLWLNHLEAREFDRAMASVAVGINLRYPQAGETSGIGVRLMGAGKPVVFTEGDELSVIPDDACLRVSPGLGEADELLHLMRLLVESPTLARRIGQRAAEHIRAFHGIERVAGLYWDVLKNVKTKPNQL